jgi:hypothetical protein
MMLHGLTNRKFSCKLSVVVVVVVVVVVAAANLDLN